jgi:Domain of unknown function (DUF4082)/Bacterial Ig-like domain/Bacterial Ig-like domain (group 2)/Putative Ig domain
MKHKRRVIGGFDKLLIALLLLLAPVGRVNAQSDPNQGPGGPILVITSSSSTFGKYYAEILRTEGLNEFAVMDIGSVTATTLSAYDVVILAPAALTAGQVSMLSTWVTAGGNLIAMQPDAQLNSLLGLTSAGATLSNADVLVDTSTSFGNGIVNQVTQFHGAANRYTLSGATSLATLYTNFTTGTSNPAVTIRNVGTSGGHAAAFAYDLATSIVYMRQGNPAWAAQERDGTAPIRSDDKFFGAAVGDPQPDWVDLNDEVAIPQADEQQRFLANLILQMNLAKKPLPRFWYFPRGKKAVVIMTGDDHANGGTAGRFDQYIAASPAGCNVANWECIRSTSYIYVEPQNLSNAQAASYAAQGFEVGLHINTNCADFTPASLDTFYSQQIADFNNSYPAIPTLFTERHHCIAWSDWITAAKTELKYGMRLDTSYYFWPPGWVQNRPGHFTGSAMPMRFADLDGTLVDVYNATTQMTDESGQTYPFTSDALLSAAVGPQGYYGAFTVNAHTDSVSNPVSDGALSSALSRGIPVVSSAQMLTWLDGRNSSSFGSFAWASNTLSFNITLGSGSTGLQAMVPRHSTAGVLTTVTGPSGAVTLTIDTIKGVEYAFFAAATGAYTATYTPDGTPPTVTSTSPAAGATGVSQSVAVTATFSEAMDPTTVNANTFVLRDASNVVVPASITYIASTHTATLTPNSPLAAAATYTANLTPGVKDLSGNGLANLTWSFSTAAAPSCPCTIWSSSATPLNPSVVDPNSVELGVKFRADLNGFITGVRFYKGAANTGVHVGNLWNSAGQLLATANFTNETASGWQQVNFSSPVVVTANTVYIASYFTAVGNYAGDNGFFAASGVDNFPLHALQDGVSGGDGVYAYSASSIFPTNTFMSTNYWVDVVFAVSGATLTSIAVTPANPTIQIGATQQFTATGTYSDNSTQNITGQVAWTSSKTSVATVNSAGLATAVSAGNAAISATQGAISGSATLTVAPPALIIVTGSPLPPGTVGGAYSTTLAASGGTPPYTWSIVTGSGALPAGLTLNATTGGITGTPVASGTFTFTVQVVDSFNPEAPVSKPFSMTISAAAPLSVTSTVPVNGATAVGASTTVSATFNNPLDATTINASTFNVKAGAITVSGSYSVSNNIATFTPGSALASLTTYTATLTTGVKDVNGSALAANVTWTFTTACTSNCTIWPVAAVPTRPDDGPDSAVELGVKFRADSNGRISGIRFYKSAANTGTHVGNLWSSTGQLLASAIFTGETASGWQQVSFVTPVSITANTVYVASYHTNGGHYADDQNFFTAAGVDNPPVHALQAGISGFNGAYAYGASSIFPSQGFNSSNYWVDVVFSSGTAPPNTGFLGPTANAPVSTSAGDNNGFETTPANAQTAADGLLAVDANSGTNTTASCTDAGKDKHDFFNYNFSLPPAAAIQGIEVRLDSKVNSTANAPLMCVQVSWNGGATWTTAQSTPTLTTATATYVFGGPSNTLGRTWAVGEFSNANFRVRIIDVAASTARTFSLDWIAVRITYQ